MIRAYGLDEKQLKKGQLGDFFPFLDETGHVVAIVGAGGKTTLMYELAEQFRNRSKRVAVTTTTHILRPEHSVPCHTLQECQERWAEQEYAVWGTELDNGKLGALRDEDFQKLMACADVVLVEADGAKRMACKVPAAHEPVIPPETDIVIGVVGLDVLGQPLEKVCFRIEEATKLLGCDTDHILTTEDLVTIVQSEQGTHKGVGERDYYIVLNKCDDMERRVQGEEILRRLSHSAVMTCFGQNEQGMSDWSYDIKLRIRGKDVENRAFFGPGVAELMERIREEGQMTKACRSMGMSYSKGWKILKHASEAWGAPLAKGSSGGGKGGHMVLTSEGEELLRRFREMEEELKQAADRIFVKYFDENDVFGKG